MIFLANLSERLGRKFVDKEYCDLEDDEIEVAHWFDCKRWYMLNKKDDINSENLEIVKALTVWEKDLSEIED